MTDFRSIRWANDPEHIASRFQQYRRVMDHWQAVLPVPIHEVDYEETVADLEACRAAAGRGLRPASGTRPAWSSTATTGPSAPPASPRSASRSTSDPSLAGRTTNPNWASCSRRFPVESPGYDLAPSN